MRRCRTPTAVTPKCPKYPPGQRGVGESSWGDYCKIVIKTGAHSGSKRGSRSKSVLDFSVSWQFINVVIVLGICLQIGEVTEHCVVFIILLIDSVYELQKIQKYINKGKNN